MNIVETSVLLAKIQAFDNRNVDDQTMAAWHEILAPHTLPDCLATVTDYFRKNTAWIMPANVVERVTIIERDRVARFGGDPRLSDFECSTTNDYRAASKTLFRAIKTGQLERAAYDKYLTSEVTIASVLGAKELTQ